VTVSVEFDVNMYTVSEPLVIVWDAPDAINLVKDNVKLLKELCKSSSIASIVKL